LGVHEVDAFEVEVDAFKVATAFCAASEEELVVNPPNGAKPVMRIMVDSRGSVDGNGEVR
jgi:hypothetical protein